MGFAGQRALLLYPPGLDFVESFCGCLYAGVVPVPAYPPRRNRNMMRINSISHDADAAVALTIKSVVSRSDGSLAEAQSLRRIPWLATEETPNELASDWIKPKISSENLGLIQYTSGSTGSPKGVVLTHRNLMANSLMIMHAFGMTREKDRGVFWLPTYHDMGLIGGIVMPVCFAAEITLLSPVTFLTRPLRWLKAISDYRGAISGGPNFAYRWCTMKIQPEECEGLDLSSWKVAFNGAEPVRGTRRPRCDGHEPRRDQPGGGLAVQDRQRHPLPRLGAAIGPRRAGAARERAGLVDHAGQGQPDAV